MERILIETNRRQNALHDFLGKNKTIRTIGIISPENPMGLSISKEENNKRVEQFKKYLNNTQTRYQRVKGMYNNLEHSFMLFNTTVSDLKWFGKVFNQESFIFGVFNYNDDTLINIKFDYYLKEDTDGEYILKEDTDGEYILKDIYTGYKKCFDSKDFYTIISKNFKFNIPFSIFESECYDIQKLVDYRKEVLKEYADLYDTRLSRAIDDNITSRSRSLARANLYGICCYPYEQREQLLKEEQKFLNRKANKMANLNEDYEVVSNNLEEFENNYLTTHIRNYIMGYGYDEKMLSNANALNRAIDAFDAKQEYTDEDINEMEQYIGNIEYCVQEQMQYYQDVLEYLEQYKEYVEKYKNQLEEEDY